MLHKKYELFGLFRCFDFTLTVRFAAAKLRQTQVISYWLTKLFFEILNQKIPLPEFPPPLYLKSRNF